MFGHQKTRLDIQTETGLKGKELTHFIKENINGGG